jgi:hypothetical protein
MRSIGIKVAAFVGIGCVAISVLPAVKQASTFRDDGHGSIETKKRIRERARGEARAGAGVREDAGNSPDKTASLFCPKLSEIISCPDAPSQDDAIYCRDCISQPLETTYRVPSSASASIERPDHKIYMPVLTPPFFGSSVLSNILSTSPYVTNMCKDPYLKGRIPWQCESTPTLVREGVLTKKTRWDPLTTNWTAAYETYDRLRVWTDMDKPIRLDKAPPNIAKSKKLVEFYESNGMDYRFVVMMRHPCRKDWQHPKFPTLRYSSYLREVLDSVPEEKRFLINYDDLVTRPGEVLRDLLKWFPLLKSLSLDIDRHELIPSKMNPDVRQRKLRGAAEGGSLLSYIQTDKCLLYLRQDSASTPSDEIGLWNQNFLKSLA